jgi:hypothetical protein
VAEMTWIVAGVVVYVVALAVALTACSISAHADRLAVHLLLGMRVRVPPAPSSQAALVRRLSPVGPSLFARTDRAPAPLIPPNIDIRIADGTWRPVRASTPAPARRSNLIGRITRARARTRIHAGAAVAVPATYARESGDSAPAGRAARWRLQTR